jgi:hypothetical protein
LGNKKLITVVLLLVVTAGAWASTKLRVSWHNPNYARPHFKTILVIGMSNNLQTRTNFEVALAGKIARPASQPSRARIFCSGQGLGNST